MSEAMLNDNGLCFVCGPNNPAGLHLSFAWDADSYFTEWTPLPTHQGWGDRAHGGLLATVLDETLLRAALDRHGLGWVTAELTTRMTLPARIGEALRVTARIVTVRTRLIICEGEVRRLSDNALVAWGQAKLMRAR